MHILTWLISVCVVSIELEPTGGQQRHRHNEKDEYNNLSNQNFTCLNVDSQINIYMRVCVCIFIFFKYTPHNL